MLTGSFPDSDDVSVSFFCSWRTKPGCEVDFVLEKKSRVIAIEVKSNSDPGNEGLAEFKAQYKPYLALVVGDGGMIAEDFLSINPADLFK